LSTDTEFFGEFLEEFERRRGPVAMALYDLCGSDSRVDVIALGHLTPLQAAKQLIRGLRHEDLGVEDMLWNREFPAIEHGWRRLARAGRDWMVLPAEQNDPWSFPVTEYDLAG
jgi:hypothetical protein